MATIIKKARSKNGIPKVIKKESFVTPKNDLSSYHYTRSWDQGLTTEVYGYTINIPDMPPKEEIINYGKPITEQIFRKTLQPSDLSYLPEDEKEAFIENEHHRRREGLWFYIKGEPVYIPGVFYYFLNYWTVQTGKPTKFRMGDWKFFILWMHVVLTPTIFGLIIFKCRRIGDTEKALCIVYEYATRVKNTINQMYDCRVEKDMIKTWKRLKLAHQKMVWFMKPLTKNDDPAQVFEFRTPKRKIDHSNSVVDENGQLHISDYKYPEMDSEIAYYTNDGGADGTRIGREYVDEFGKYDQINPLDLWDLSKKALEDDSEGEIIGKALFTSTIEEMKGGETLKTSKKLWEDSDPANLGPDGRTVSGMIRCVRGALDRAETDRWGFVDEEEVLKKIKEQQDFLIANKKWESLITFKRQNCLNIQDVFSNISKGSPFNLTNINNRLNEIEHAEQQKWVKGNFEWVDGIAPVPGDPDGTNKKCKVYFHPCEDGRWELAWHPKDFNVFANAMELSKIPSPGNRHAFSTGIDPVAYKNNLENKDKISKAGLAVKRNLDPSIDNLNILFDKNGVPEGLGLNFKTNRYCCVYLHRHDSPSENYEDWLKTLIYYGSDFLIEKNHSAGFQTYLELMNFSEYYYDGGTGIANYRGKQENFGLTAGEKSVEAYFGALAELCAKWINTIDLPLILQQLSTMEYETRGDHDLGVAVGFCELLANAKSQEIKQRNEYENQPENQFMDENVFSGD